MPSQLVAYRGFSATNYIQEAFSPDLDFGVGEWSVGGWVNYSMGNPNANLLHDATEITAAKWTSYFNPPPAFAQGVAAPDGTLTATRITPSANEYNTSGIQQSAERPVYSPVTASAWLRGVAGPMTVNFGTNDGYAATLNLTTEWARYSVICEGGIGSQGNRSFQINAPTGQSFDIWHPQTNVGVVAGVWAPGDKLAVIVERSASTGPVWALGVNRYGDLVATAFDGTTTRTVTTPAAYNTGVFTKAEATYTAAGKLGITVNGVEVAGVSGTPLLSLNTGTPRHNLMTKTGVLGDGGLAWGWVGAAPTLSSEADPNGTFTAYSVGVFDAANDRIDYATEIPATNSGTYTYSVYFRGTGQVVISLNTTTGQGPVRELRIALSNSWTRYSISNTYNGESTGNIRIHAAMSRDGDSPTVFMWHPQLEKGAISEVYQAVNTATDYDTAASIKATLTIGNSRTLDAPFPGSITMLKLGATVPTPEQSLWMYEQEKHMFRADAQITLPASTAVNDLTYDESQDKWVALQAGYESSFTGLIRTSAAVPSAGNFSKVDAKRGVKLLARTTTSPGVDVTIPAQGLREELVRRGEAAAKASKTLTVFDFDAIAAQTDFVLPVGWTATEVLNNGAAQREGATKSFTRRYDGFRETIKFAVAPGAAAWVQITARKE